MGDPVPSDDLPDGIPSPGDVASKFIKRLDLKVPSGAAVPPSDLPSYPVSYPSEIPARMKSLPELIKQAAPPTLAGVGAEAALTALGVPEVGLAPMLLRAGVSGVTNIGTSKLLPEKYGGQPNASALSDFAWGAAPQLLSSGIKTGLNWNANRQLAHAGDRMRAAAEGSIIDPENLKVQQTLLAPSAAVPFPDINQPGPLLTQQANEARRPIQQVIQAARTKYGKPIGDAYRALKGDQPLTEDEAGELADDSQNLLKSMISPGPMTARYAQIMKKFAPPSEEEKAAAQTPSILKPIELPDGTIVVPGAAKLSPESLKLQGYSDQQIEKLLGKQEPYKPPTLDRLRTLRQQINGDLQRAKGGDVYGLGRLQDQLDDRLMEHLPDNMQGLRAQYRGFIKRWGYDREHRLADMADPNEISKEVFKNPRDGYELMTEAPTPELKGAMRDRFIQYVWGDVPGRERVTPSKDLAADVRTRLAPYMGDPKVAAAMLGSQPAKVMGQMVSWAKYAPELKQQLEKNPQAREAFQQAFNEYFLRRGMKPADATVKGMQKMLVASPGAAQIAGDAPLQLPPNAPANRMGRMSAMFGARHAALAGLHVAVGNVGWGAYQAAEALSYLAGSHGFNAASKMGTTRFFINAFKASNPMSKGWLFARALDATAQGGGQYARAALSGDDDAAQ